MVHVSTQTISTIIPTGSAKILFESRSYIKVMVACHAFKDFLVDVTRDDVYVDGVKILDERGLPLKNAKTTQHWAQGFIVNESEKFAQKTIGDRAVRYYTVDVNPRAEIAGDIFSPEFAQQKAHFFDLAFLPDCGGLWATSQGVAGGTESPEALAEGVRNVARTVRPGGKLYLGKILNEDVVETAIGMLMSQGIIGRTRETKGWNFSAQANEDRFGSRAEISPDYFLQTYVLTVL